MLLKLAWRNLWRNKRRTLITAGSVSFAVLLTIFVKSLKEGVYQRMIDNMVSVYTGFVQVHREGFWKEQLLDNSFALEDSVLLHLQKIPDVTGHAPRIETFMLAASANLSRGTMLVGIDPEKENEITGIKSRVVDGAYLQPDEQAALIGDRLATFLDLKVNDTIVLIGQGFHGATAAGKYPVKGLVRFGSPELRCSIVYLPVKEAEWLLNMDGRLTSLVINVQSHHRAKNVAGEIQKRLGDDYESMPWNQLLPELEQTIEWDRWEGYILTSILYIIVTFGIFGTLLMMMSERQYEFGVLVALGMKRIQIAAILVMEVTFMSLLGALSGIALMIPVAIWFYHFPIYLSADMAGIYEEYGFEAVLQSSVEPYIFYNQALAVLALALVASIFPILKILKLNPLDAMKN